MTLPSLGFAPAQDMAFRNPGPFGDPNDLLNQILTGGIQGPGGPQPIGAELQSLIDQYGMTILASNPELVEEANRQDAINGLLLSESVDAGNNAMPFPLAQEASGGAASTSARQGGGGGFPPNVYSALTAAGAGVLGAPTGQFTQGLGAGFGAFGSTLDKLDQFDRTSEIAEDRNNIYRKSTADQKLARAATLEKEAKRIQQAQARLDAGEEALLKDADEVKMLAELIRTHPNAGQLKIPEGVILTELPVETLRGYANTLVPNSPPTAKEKKETPEEKRAAEGVIDTQETLDERVDEIYKDMLKDAEGVYIPPEKERLIRNQIRDRLLSGDPFFDKLTGTSTGRDLSGLQVYPTGP